jgi:hypothetical protein
LNGHAPAWHVEKARTNNKTFVESKRWVEPASVMASQLLNWMLALDAKSTRLCLVGVLLAVELGGTDKVYEGGLSLGPLAGLQTAVRVDPKLVGAEVSDGR